MLKSVRHSLPALLLLSFASGSAFGASSAKDEAIEEVIVTGSYIRRDNFDIPSPINVTTEIDLDLAGTADLGDIIFDQSFQFGVNANAAPFEGNRSDDQQWNQGQEVWANLRGLGTRATMTMMDSHRLPADTNTWGRRAGVDINGTYPQIAVGRIETILDGASALYGAEAVGGVINIIPKKDFEGLEIAYDMQQAVEKGAPVTNLSMLAGVQGERGGAIFAVELRRGERMRYTDRPEFILAAVDPWGRNEVVPYWHDAADRATPGDFKVPDRNAVGDYKLTAFDGNSPLGFAATNAIVGYQRSDPGCEYGFGSGYSDRNSAAIPAKFLAFTTYQQRDEYAAWIHNDFQKPGNFLNGIAGPGAPRDPITGNVIGGDCRMVLSDMQDMQAESSNKKAMAYFHYDFNDNIKLRGEVVISMNDYNTRDVTGGVDEIDTNELLGPFSAMIIGHNPGNPFRAFADGSNGFPDNNRLDWTDLNGDKLYQYGVEPGEWYIFARDTDGDGRPDRDYNGDGIADRNAQNDVRAIPVMFSKDTDTDGNGIPDRFDQNWALANGGVRLFEDVRLAGGNQINVNPKQPRNNTNDWAINDGGLIYMRRFIRDNVRIRLGSEISIPNSDWIVDVDYVWTKGHRENNYPEPLLAELIKSLRCEGGSDLSGVAGGQGGAWPGNGSCWNPFSTSWLNTTADGQLIGDRTKKFPADNDPGWRPFRYDSNKDGKVDELDNLSPEVNSELENRQAGIVIDYQIQDLGMQLIDVVSSTGSLFNLPWNDQPVGFALGLHHRVEREEFKPSMVNQAATGGGKRGLRESEQETNSIFGEFQLPLLDSPRWGNAELQLAARYEEIETIGIVGQEGKAKFSTTIPKIALRYAPTDWVAMRASKTKGFVTPGLYAIFGTPLQYSGPGTNGGGREVVRDYLCDALPELAHCSNVTNRGGRVPNVLAGSTPNKDLGAETSDLYNIGLSFRLLEGDLSIDVDYTNVEFRGRAEQIGASVNVSGNEIGFEEYMKVKCPTTVYDFDKNTTTTGSADYQAQVAAFAATMTPTERTCRENAAKLWVSKDSNGGAGEAAIGGSTILRGDGTTGLGLTVAESPWIQSGKQLTETVIYALLYRFDADQIPFVGGDYGSFAFNISATQMLTAELTRYTSAGCPATAKLANGRCPSDSPYAGITVDGVGNRNSTQGFTSDGGASENLYLPLAPTPEWRINAGLRWFQGNHTAQLGARWHDSVTNVNVAHDPLREAGLLSTAQAAASQITQCDRAPSQVCKFGAEIYWDLSYSYDKPDFMGFNLNVNLALRNIFDQYPAPALSASGHESYLDNIMGRMAYVRVTASL